MKDYYIESLEEILNICNQSDISSDIKDEVNNLKSQIQDFKFKIPLVGGFNAGKSSLINKFLGEKILAEEITPETAIAAEIKYGPAMILAHTINGDTKKLPLDELKNLDANEFKYVEVFLNNENLRKLGEEVVIVDMPGFDSRLEDHNKAILQYLDNGIAFVLVMDCEDGCLKSSLLTFLYELSSYQLNFGVVVNKIDKKISSEIDLIVDGVRDTVMPIYNDAYVETTSIFNEDSSEKFAKIINNFNKEEIFKKCFEEKILGICSRIISRLNIIVKNSNIDVNDINKKINDIQSKILELDKKIEKEERILSNKLENQTKENIINDIKVSLLNNSSTLASAIMEGEHVFTSRLNELLRPILLNATSSNVEPLFSGLIDNISSEMENVSNIADNVQSSLDTGMDKIQKISSSLEKINLASDNFQKFDKFYKLATTGLAIFTGVVAPWLELIIVFLPDIINVFNSITGNSKHDKMKSKMENEIIPQIVDKLRPEVQKSLQAMKDQFMEELIAEINNKKVDLENSLTQAIEMKDMKNEEFNTKMDEINANLDKMIKIVDSILEGENYEY